MIDNEKRRRAVAELRKASTGAYCHVDALDVIAGSVGVNDEGKFDHDVEKETYAALADLIDRPTCQMVECSIDNGSRSWGMRCTACGKECFPHAQVGSKREEVMAYSDYGAFVYFNGKRRTDKEDVGVYDTDEASMPSGLLVLENIMKLGGGGEWFERAHHGVMGDGSVRVGCYKQGWPEVYEWDEGADKPTRYTFNDFSRKFGWDDYIEYDGRRYAPDEYDNEFDFLGWHFHFWGDDCGDTPAYVATMSRDGENWNCEYDYSFGAGFDDDH